MKGARFTVLENHRKSLIQHCQRSELHLQFEWTKKSIQKLVHFGKLLKLNFAVKQCYLKGQKLGEMPKLAFSPNETF